MIKGIKSIIGFEAIKLQKLIDLIKLKFNYLYPVFFSNIQEKSIFEKDFPNQFELFYLNSKHILAPEYTAVFTHEKINYPVMYFMKCFRHENPQFLRKREFIQFGVELNNNKILIELVIDTLFKLLDSLNIKYEIQYNFLNSLETRLVTNEYFNDNKNTIDYSFFTKMKRNTTLYRGLGYYEGFIFQIYAGDNLQIELGGGGCYDNNFGFALGLEPRLLSLCNIKIDWFNLIVRNSMMNELNNIINILNNRNIKFFLNFSIDIKQNNIVINKNTYELLYGTKKIKTTKDLISLLDFIDTNYVY